MALIKCPECGKEISEKAAACPNCGCPITKEPNMETEKAKHQNAINQVIARTTNKKVVIAVIAGILIVLVAVFVGVVISKKNSIKNAKIAMDNVDIALNELLVEMNPEEPFLYGDAASDSHKEKIKELLDKITENQKIVDDAYKNEDRESIKELDSYISTNKAYRSWDEYNTAIKKLYGNSITNEQAADDIVRKIASTKEEYEDYKNLGFRMMLAAKGQDVDFDIDKAYDPDTDFFKIGDRYVYDVGNIHVVYLGDKHPKTFKAKFTLIGTGGKVLATEEWGFEDETGSPYIYADGWKRITYEEAKTVGMNRGDSFSVGYIHFYSDVKDTPTDVKMTVLSGDD